MNTDNRQSISDPHPVDALSVALARSAGLLATLGHCYDNARGTFVVNEQFLVQAILTAETFVNDAQSALSDICVRCDLTLGSSVPDALMPAATGKSRVGASTIADDRVDQDIFSDPVPEAPVVLPLPSLHHLAVLAATTLQPTGGTSAIHGGTFVAQSYDEFLRKLTAAEVFAAEQQAMAPSGTQGALLPLLRSLRDDLQKMVVAA